MRELLREFPTARLSLFLVFNGFRPVWNSECERIYMNPIRVIISSDGYGDFFLNIHISSQFARRINQSYVM